MEMFMVLTFIPFFIVIVNYLSDRPLTRDLKKAFVVSFALLGIVVFWAILAVFFDIFYVFVLS